MYLSSIRKQDLGFAGIYGTAIKIDKNGVETPININLEQEDAFLKIEDAKSVDHYKEVKLLIKQPDSEENNGFVLKKLDDTAEKYKDVKIDKINKNSELRVKSKILCIIGVMKDNCLLMLQGSKKDSSYAEIDTIKGKNVHINLSENSSALIKNECSFKLKTPNINNNFNEYPDDNSRSAYARIEGASTGLMIKG